MKGSDEDVGGTIQLGEVQITSLEEQSPSFDEQNSRLWGVVGHQSVQIILGQRAYLQVLSHARSDLRHEVGGMLVGRAYKFEGKIYVEVNGGLPARMTQSSAVHVTFSAETWIEAQRELREQFPEAQIVGWYHSHPGIGVFLSGQDVFIQEHFFNHPWQIALVVDPIAWQSRFFVWQEQEIMIAHSCYETFDLTSRSSLVESLIPVAPAAAKQVVEPEATQGTSTEEELPRTIPNLGHRILQAIFAWVRYILKREKNPPQAEDTVSTESPGENPDAPKL